MTNSAKRTRVIGCGNPLMGNDGAGVLAAEMLKELRPDIDTIEGGTGGIGLINDMEGFDRIIIIDAMLGIGENKGDIKIFYETPPVIPSTMSIHDAGISEVIEVAKEIIPGIEIITVGIEADFVEEYSEYIDPEIIAGIDKALKEIVIILEK
ncbi:hydrogenase maturation protease [Methanoplanus endosymbiosus]|uniref:Hydrogenase maturation protease n=1 Tax=Methanoplanus endosymbiosus TaxID=33865 RepID=A0A9E7PNK7_9EURY|nr:hydrogenase maturation protease [Methanoplanus endosymbiosus]UUX93605.1 hydrogenase maturation protease [Methanoplanus endosymbiosus]